MLHSLPFWHSHQAPQDLHTPEINHYLFMTMMLTKLERHPGTVTDETNANQPTDQTQPRSLKSERGSNSFAEMYAEPETSTR